MHGNRTRLRQELEKQRQELERNREEIDARMRREAAVNHQSSSMEVPANRGGASGGNQVTVEVPTTILEVRTKLAHPTNFHVNQVQKRQVNNFLSSGDSPIQQSQSAPLQKAGLLSHAGGGGFQGGNLSIMKDPLLSRAASGESPMKTSSSFNPQMRSALSGSSLNSPVGSTFPPQMLEEMGGMFNNHGGANITINTPDSPTMMATEQGSDIQEQIIEDIMGLEEKFGDTLGLPYLESTLMTPQTLPISSHLFDTFGGGSGGVQGGVSSMSSGGNQMVVSQISASCPANMKNDMELISPGEQGGIGDLRFNEKERQKKNNHNMIERRRRFNINDRIKELGSLLPAAEAEARVNKGTILKASVDYIRKLQRDYDKMKLVESKQRQLEDTNRHMRLRIQELELTARAHQIPTPSLTPETYKLAEAAEHALGSVTPRSKSPGSANMTPVHMFGSDDLVDILRNSPGMDLSKLQIKQERMESISPCSIDHRLSPLQRPPSGGGPISYPQTNQRIGDIFSFNLPITTQNPSLAPPPLQSATPHSGLQLFSNT